MALSYRSDFFTAQETEPGVYDREYSAEIFANRFAKMFSTGVVVDGGGLLTTELEVSLVSGMDVQIAVGYALINGYAFEIYGAAEELTVEAADPSNPRIDRVILELDTATARAITHKILKGTAAASPSAPALTQTDELYQISLAQILVSAGATSILGGDITDERDDDTLCGLAQVQAGYSAPTGYEAALIQVDNDNFERVNGEDLQTVLDSIEQELQEDEDRLDGLEDLAGIKAGVQSNAVANSYETDLDFDAYADTMRFLFIPLHANTSACTINVNALGAKKIVSSSGTQISGANNLRAKLLYLLEYDSTKDSGNGALVLTKLSPHITVSTSDASGTPGDGDLWFKYTP
jgi:hypothetical protein